MNRLQVKIILLAALTYSHFVLAYGGSVQQIATTQVHCDLKTDHGLQTQFNFARTLLEKRTSSKVAIDRTLRIIFFETQADIPLTHYLVDDLNQNRIDRQDNHRGNSELSAGEVLTAKKSDPIDTENNMGIGLKVDSLLFINRLALAAGFQSTSVSGTTTGILNAGVGYIF